MEFVLIFIVLCGCGCAGGHARACGPLTDIMQKVIDKVKQMIDKRGLTAVSVLSLPQVCGRAPLTDMMQKVIDIW